MMDAKECAETWKTLCTIYDDTREKNRPDITAKELISTLGMDKTKEVLATVASIKKHDGRISGRNREFLSTVPINPVSLEWTGNNPMVNTGKMDHIHTTHIDNIISAVIKIDRG